MESIFESAPQALLQLTYLLTTTNNMNVFIIIAFFTSLMSISWSIMLDDEWSFDEKTNAAEVLSPFEINELKNGCQNFICCCSENSKNLTMQHEINKFSMPSRSIDSSIDVGKNFDIGQRPKNN